MMTPEQVLRMVADGAGAARIATSASPDGVPDMVLRLVQATATVAADLVAAGVADPVDHIERVFDDAPMIAQVRSQREAALRAKFPNK